MSAGTKTLVCKCDSTFQDKTYGNNRRLMNHADKKGAEKDRYKCTSCGEYHRAKTV